MAKVKNKKTGAKSLSCRDCIHEWACSMQCYGNAMRSDNANRCACYEDVNGSAAYYIGYTDGKTQAAMEPADVTPVPRWIRAKERVPERDGKYLCVYVFQNGSGMQFTAALDYYAADPNPHFQYEGSYGMGMKVTHWMPLPPLPKEDA